MNFENPQFEPHRQKNQEAPPPRPLFERLRKSRIAQVIAVLGALGIGAEIGHYNHHVPEKQKIERSYEKKKIDPRNFPNLEINTEISSEDQSIVHIGQIHGGETIADTQGMIEHARENGSHDDIGTIIASQKNVEKTLLELNEKYNSHIAYVESVMPETMILVNDFRNLVKNSLDGVPGPTTDKLESLIGSMKIPERYKAWLFYIMKIDLEKQINTLHENLRKFQKSEAVDTRYKKLFEKEGIAEIVISQFQGQLERIGNNPLIQGDSIYLWGGAMKSYLDGKVEIRPAETQESNNRAFQNKNVPDIENVREKAAVDLIEKEAESVNEQFIPMVYGRGHDFKNSVLKHNQHNANKLGLIKMAER